MNEKLLDYFNGDDLAADTWQRKYAQEGEITPDNMHKRMAKEFARIEKNYIEPVPPPTWNSLSYYGRHRDNLDENSIYNYFKDFKYIIPQGSIMSQLGADSIGSLSNCFVIGQPEDSYGGIFQKDEELAQLMKRRGGVGLDISTLRPAGTNTSNAAKTTTGAVSFMHRFSNTTREVAQNGRRGALMLSIDINHPDVMEFIKIKRDLTQVTGANISIKLNDEFMKAVENDEDYILRFPCDIPIPEDLTLHYQNIIFNDCGVENLEYNKLHKIRNTLTSENNPIYVKKIKAREYWDEIIKSAHNVAEPGLMFWNAMIDYSPDGIYEMYKAITTNPCSEIGMQPDDACRLIAVVLFSFVRNPFTDNAYFDFEEFYKVNYEAMRLSDDLIDLELQHIDRILEKILSDPESIEVRQKELELWSRIRKTAMSSRRTGLGFTALGDTLAALGLKYDSDDSKSMIEEIMQTKMKSELDCTIDMAITRGTFESWDNQQEFVDDGGDGVIGTNDFYQFISDYFPEQTQRMYKYGRRNVSWSTVAPTGTVSLMAQTTSGIEPLFQPYYTRRKKVNSGEKGIRVDFTDQNGDNWQEFFVLHPLFKDWILTQMDKTGQEPDIHLLDDKALNMYFEMSPWYGSTANDIDWISRVETQSIIQKYISHSISSTINLPEDVSEEEVSKIYMESWKRGLKGITVYREGSRSGVLISKSISESSFEQKDAPKRPKSLPCEVHQTKNRGNDWLVVVGLMNKKPYEVFCVPNIFSLPSGILSGDLNKKSRGVYELDIRDVMTIDNICTNFGSDEQEAMTRLLSTSLRHGADIKFIVEQLNKSSGDITSFSKAIARVLKKYIPDGVKSTMTCSECQSNNVIFEEGCSKCLDCGSSKCG